MLFPKKKAKRIVALLSDGQGAYSTGVGRALDEVSLPMARELPQKKKSDAEIFGGLGVAQFKTRQ